MDSASGDDLNDLGVHRAGPLLVRIFAAEPVAGYLRRRFADLTGPTGPVDHTLEVGHIPDQTGWHVRLDGEPRTTAVSPTAVMDQLMAWLNICAASDPDHLGLHSGAVANRSGAVLLPGSAGAGKTTLTAALVRSGFAYLTDELAAIRTTATSCVIEPYPKPLTFKAGTVALFGDLSYDAVEEGAAPTRWHVRPGELGGEVGGPSEVRAIMFVSHEPGVTHCSPCGNTETAMALATNVHAGSKVRLGQIAQLATTARAWRLSFDRLDEAVAAVDAALDEPPLSSTFRLFPEPTQPGETSPFTTDGAVPAPAEGVLAAVFGDGAVVHQPATETLVALDTMGATVWPHFDSVRTVAEIAAALADRFGADVRTVRNDVLALCNDLAEEGVLGCV